MEIGQEVSEKHPAHSQKIIISVQGLFFRENLSTRAYLSVDRMGNSASSHHNHGGGPYGSNHSSTSNHHSGSLQHGLRDIEQLDEEPSFNNNLPPSQFKMENEKNNNDVVTVTR